jgi:hypothetical protein
VRLIGVAIRLKMEGMRLLLTFACAAGLALSALPASAQPPTVKQLTVKVGEAGKIHLAFPAASTVCDDLSLIRVEDGGDFIRVVGVKAGKTKCGFWRVADAPLPTVLVEITVVAAQR